MAQPSSSVRTAFTYAVAAAALGALYVAREAVLVAFLGVICALVIDALARLLEKIRVPRGVAVGASGLLLLAVLAGTVALVATPVVTESTALMASLPEKTATVRRELHDAREKYPLLAEVIPSGEADGAKTEPGAASAARVVAVTASRVVEGFLTVLAVIFLGVFLALDPDRYVSGAARVLGGAPPAERVELLERMGSGLRSWLLAMGAQIVVTAILWTVGLWLIGIPYAVLFGVLAGLVEVVPYLGPMLGLVLPLGAAATESAAKAGAVVAVYAVIHIFEGYVLVPFVMQKREHLPPAIVLLSIMVFGPLFGLLGVVLAVPLGTVAYIWGRESLLGSSGRGERAPEGEPRRLKAA
jgi:predicted PurR-regulated permease PerM